MHGALFIDEILRRVFAFSSEKDRPSLVAAACCCKAWHDPALDFLWDRLTSFAPLLLLLPQIQVINGEYVLADGIYNEDLSKFNSYAQRVKHVKVRREFRIRFGSETISTSEAMKDVCLPRLTTAHISVPQCSDILIPLYYSPNLVQLDIDLGFKPIPFSTNDTICDLLERVAQCPELRRISLRGTASGRLNDAIASLPNLDFLSLRLGNKLLPSTFAAIMNFPHLLELEIHAGHLQFHEFNDVHGDSIVFTSLRKLHIRAQATLIEDILHHIPPNTLQHLHIELDDQTACPTFWNTIFSSISGKIGNVLIHLSLEHHFEAMDLSLSIPSDIIQTSDITATPPSSFSTTAYIPFETLKLLQNTKQLRHFSCDVTLPPPLNDDDLDKMATWWPNLEHFELGSSVHSDELEPPQSCQMTTSCLESFAKRSGGLKRLILPVAIDDALASRITTTRPAINNQLQSLTIARLTTTNPVAIAQYLHTLFPALTNLEGPCDDTEVWSETLDALRVACCYC